MTTIFGKPCKIFWQRSLKNVIVSRFFPFFDVQDTFCNIFFSCDQAALWMVLSVRLSITPFSLCSLHRITMKFPGIITNDQCKAHAKDQGQRSKVKVTETKTPLNRFRTVAPVWIHIWWSNDDKAWCCLEEVPSCFSRSSVKFQGHMDKNLSILTQIGRIQTVTPVWIHQWLRNDAQSLK